MAAAGFEPEDFEGECFEVWPENWPAFDVFAQLDTQWRTGMNGPTGLDYAALYPLLDRIGLADPDWRQMFDDVRTLESAALAEIRKK